MGRRFLKETRLFWRYLLLAVRMRRLYITDWIWGLIWQMKKHREGNAPTIKIPMEFTRFVDAVSCDYKSQTHQSDTQQKAVLQVTSFTIWFTVFHPGVSPGLSFLLPDSSWFQPGHQDHLASEVEGNDGSEDEELSTCEKCMRNAQIWPYF